MVMNSTAMVALASIGFLSAAAMPAWAQTVAPAAESADSGTRAPASIPDFSGIWAHLIWPDVEPPPSGPGPVQNMSRRNGMSNIYQLVGD
jgi:hypothetical protein